MKNDHHQLIEKVSGLKGCHAQMWHYVASHCRLCFQIPLKGAGTSYIVFVGCSKIRSDVFWRIDSPLFSIENNGNIRFADGDGMNVICEDFYLTNEYKI